MLHSSRETLVLCRCNQLKILLHSNRNAAEVSTKIPYARWLKQYFIRLGNLPVERAKDTVWFLQWCGVSLVSSYAVCFLQWGGVSLASSAIIYNIVKVKVTHWPVNPFDPFDPLTRRPVDLFEKEPLKGNCEVHVHTPLRCSAAKGAELDSAAASKRDLLQLCGMRLAHI